MTDNLHTWLNERETIHAHGWTGEWSWTLGELDRATLRATGPVDFDLIRDDEFRGPAEVLDEFVDAHNVAVPKLVRGVRAVLDLHKPTVGLECARCYGEWPCPTLEALQEAINDDE